MKEMLAVLERFAPSRGRPVFVLLAVLVLLVVLDRGEGFLLRVPTVFSVMQLFATLGLVALGLGIAMMMKEFDLSVAGSFALAGVVAVRTGADYPLLGILCGTAVGLCAGTMQAGLVLILRLPAVAISLGGLLILLGLTYVLAAGGNVSFANPAASRWMQAYALGEWISNRGLIVVLIYAVAVFVFAFTRAGRDLIACGSNRGGARLAGVNTSLFFIAAFAASGGLAALAGAMLAYSLGGASAIGLSDVLVPGAAAAILGGVSLKGGQGRPFGIACGVLTWCALRSGLSAVGVNAFMLDTFAGAILLLVAILDSSFMATLSVSLRNRRR